MYLIISNKTFVPFAVFIDEKEAIKYKNSNANSEIVKLSYALIQEISELSIFVNTVVELKTLKDANRI
jgi:hypothetical protein